MKIKEVFSKIGKGVCNFYMDNSKAIAKAAKTIGIAWLCKELNVPITPSAGSYDYRYKTNAATDLANYILAPSNSTESSIFAIGDSAMKQSFDSSKKQSVDRIVDILLSQKVPVEDSTKTYAINMLRRISSKMDFDSSVDYVNSKIAKIAKGDF